MEHTSCYQTQNALCSSPTADSIDMRQLLASDCTLEPLISESITLDTLSSSSSAQVPPFSTFKLPRLSIIGLGDHLKMFSGPVSQLQEPRTTADPKVIITSPTSPRLKSMFKECLCIRKWAECLTGWRAPGHIPWGSISDQNPVSEKWLPEGSLYSPEDFSRALNQARAKLVCIDATEIEHEPCGTADASLDMTTTERVDFGSSSGTLTHVELVDMMRELKDLKNFFEGTSQQDVPRIVQQPKYYPEQLTLPSLMISNSHCTIPLSLDSYQGFTLKPAANLADRRGRKVPPPLLLKNETTSPDLSYPGIPTAFLGSPSTYSPNFQDVNLANASGLRIEDMISNLRLQCSAMALHTPPVDMSWNSRSCSPSPVPAYEPVKPMEAEVAESVEPFPGPPSHASSDILGGKPSVTVTMPTGRRKGTSLSGVRAANPHEVGTATNILETAKSTRTDTPDKKSEVLSKYTPSPPLLLRSSLAKRSTFRSRSLKCVRFALSPSEFEKDVASLMYDDVWRSSRVHTQSPSHLSDNTPIRKFTTPHLNTGCDHENSEERTYLIQQNFKSRRSTSTAFKVSSVMKTKKRIKSAIIEPPLRHSMIPKFFHGNAYKAKNHDNNQRSLQPRGRHILSRIIKGPIFSGKENKRATVSDAFSTRWDFNERGKAVRDSVASESIQKRSRVPVPLRNISTRFR